MADKPKKKPYVRKKSVQLGIDSIKFTQEKGPDVELGLLFDVNEAETNWTPAEIVSISVSGTYVVKWIQE